MADIVDSRVIFNGGRRYAVRLTNISDGTGETLVKKIDITTLRLFNGKAPTRLHIEELKWDVQGFTSVRLFWNHTTPDEIDIMSGTGIMNYAALGYLVDPASAGGDGSVMLSTAGAIAGATYDITIVVQLR